MSPFVIGAWSSSSLPKATDVTGKNAAPIVAAPAATIPFVKNSRRFVACFTLLPDFFIILPVYPKNRVRIVCITRFADVT
jgi:hypothetical protein